MLESLSRALTALLVFAKLFDVDQDESPVLSANHAYVDGAETGFRQDEGEAVQKSLDKLKRRKPYGDRLMKVPF
ncbi:hypothetical protein [Rhizobium sp. LCM 4573]|uniref:hypothetical protein n=1 Tax=Rhizobium sp. LCM 4573 TaxID=1848291 RepID=UPI0008D8F001|nr:hypothetical protein [Rhizobium sp. LCM 4573]OHV82942.1 hypothetical protein LCM4573_18515 [Rhizobium sp. LCM 4573]